MAWSYPHIPKEHLFEVVLGVAIAGTLYSGALQVSLFLFTGIPPMLGPALFFSAAIMSVIYVASRAGDYPITPAFATSVLLWLGFVLWSVSSAAWSTSLHIVSDKILNLVVYSSIFYVAGLSVGRSLHALRAFRLAVIALGIVTVLGLGSMALKGASTVRLEQIVQQNGALTIFAMSYQSTTLCIGIAAVFSLVEAMVCRRAILASAWVGLWVILSLAALAGGGRTAAGGSVLAQTAVLILALTVRRTSQNKWLAGAVLALLPAGGLLAFYIALQLGLRTVDRFMAIASNSSDSTGRLTLWSRAMTMAEHHPLIGGGFGSYEATSNNFENASLYPHNVFLEALSESGIPGFLLISATLLTSAILLLRRVNSLDFASTAIWLGMFSMMLFGTFTTDTVTSRFLVFSLGMSIGLLARDRPDASFVPAS